jgi:hypothetical protein
MAETTSGAAADAAPAEDPAEGTAAATRAAPSRWQELTRGPGAPWRWGAAASVLLVVVLHTVLARGARTPSFPFDEIVLLQYSKYLSGAGEVTPPRGAGYFPAWSVVMAPIWWVTENPATAYRLAIALGVLAAVATIWPLARAVTRLGLTMPQATVVASLVMAMPARALQSGYVTSEKLLFLALACTMLAALRLWERPTVPRALVFGLAVAVLTTTHARAVVLLIACVVWLLLLALRSWRAALAGIAVALPLGYLAFRTGGQLNQHLGGGFSQGEKVLENLRESRPSIILRAVVGQAWEQTAGSLGLVAVGLVVLLVLVWRELRHGRSIGPACLLTAMLLGLAVLSIGQWASEGRLYLASWRRLDAWLYGRYLDPVTGLLVALGAAAMIRGVSRKMLVPALVLAAALLGVTVLWLAPDAPTWGYVTPAHIPGVMPWFWALPQASAETWQWGMVPSLTNANRFWLLASIPPLAVLIALVAVGRRRPRATALLTAAVLALTAAGTLSATRATDHFQRLEGGRPALAEEINRLQAEHGGELTVEFDRSCTPGLSNNAVVQNKLAYWIHPTTLGVTTDRSSSDADITLGCDIWPEGSAAGARMISDLHSYGYHAWVAPGPLQDELDAAGELEDVVPQPEEVTAG